MNSLNPPISSKVLSFWDRHPALLIGLHLTIGAALFFCWNIAYFFLLFCVWAPLLLERRGRHKTCTALLLLLASYFYSHFLYSHAVPPKAKCTGKGHFSIHSLKVGTSPFHRSFVYSGLLHEFVTKEGKTISHLPCKIFLPLEAKRPSADRDYLIEGVLIEKSPYTFLLKPTEWKTVEKTHSLAEWRFQAKQTVHTFLERHFSNTSSLHLFKALLTGDVEERLFSLEFGKVGLQHLLAISGFHFAIFAAFCSFFLRFLFPPRYTDALLLVLLTLFYLFLGDSPSIQRAWCAISIFFSARLLGRQTSALNALGCALILEIVIEPHQITHIGFQLSFLSTLALLLLYPPLENFLTVLLPKRRFDSLLSLSRLEQHVYLFCHFLRKVLAVNFAVHLALIPVLLLLFHKFPLLSLLYNLFFPLGITLSLLLFLAALPLHLLCSPLAEMLHRWNDSTTSAFLNLIIYPPITLDYSIRCNFLPFSVVILFLSLLFTGAILFINDDRVENF